MDVQKAQVLAVFVILLSSALGVSLPQLIWKAENSVTNSLSFRTAKVGSFPIHLNS